MPRREASPRMLALLIAVLLVVGVVAVAVVGPGGDDGRGGSGTSEARSTGEVGSAPGDAAGDGDGGDGGEDDGGGTGGDDGTGGGPTGDGALRPGREQAASAGRWSYRAVTRGAAGENDRELGYVVTETGRADSVVDQRHAVDVEGGQSNDISWRPDGQYLVATTFGSGDSTSTCTWQPAILLVPADIRQGDEWTTDSRCTMELARGTQGTARRQTTSRAVGARVVRVDGTQVPVWAVRTESRIEIDIDSPAQDVESVTEEAIDEQIAPSLGMSVRSIATGTTTTNGKTQESFRDLTLLAVRPS